MKYIFFVLSLLTTDALSATLTVTGPCDIEPWINEIRDIEVGDDVGQMTIEVLNDLGIPYSGSDEGLTRIKDSPIGPEAMEIISDTELKSYGWCFTVNGVQSGVYPHEIPLSEDDKVHWFFGYAHYKSGEWFVMCAPSAPERPAFICRNNHRTGQ